MQCFSCRTPVPDSVEQGSANFCIACGRPLTQLCPYEARDPAGIGGKGIQRLPLCDDMGRATAACSSCGGLFKGCDVCLRLYPLEAERCITEGCSGALHEPIPAYPSPAGPLNGTRTVPFSDALDGKANQVAYPAVDELQALAYRYGRLIGASQRYLLCWSWDGQQWRQQGLHPLDANRETAIHSLQVEQGRAFLLGKDFVQVYSLVGGLSRVLHQEGSYLLQAVGVRWWLRATEQNTLILTDGYSWQEHTVHLPADAGQISSLVVDGDFYIATTNGGLFRLNPDTDQLTSFAVPASRWVRIAIQKGQLAALGYNPDNSDNRMTLLLLTLDTQAILAQRPVEPGCLADFAWSGNHIYMARQRGYEQSLIETYNTLHLTRSPQSVALSAGMMTQPGLLALTTDPNGAAGTRLLLHRTDVSDTQIVLVNPATGAVNPIGPILAKQQPRTVETVDGMPAEGPLLCIADNQLLIASRDRGLTQIRTFAF